MGKYITDNCDALQILPKHIESNLTGVNYIRPTMSGLHTLVDGLAFSPTSPDSSSPIVSHPNTHLLASSTGTFGTSHGSIFNNPNASCATNTARIQAFGARRISYGNSSTSNTPTHRAMSSEGGVTKEVDDPSPHGSDRDRTDRDRNRKNKHITPTKMFLSPTSPGRPTRAGSYRGKHCDQDSRCEHCDLLMTVADPRFGHTKAG